MGLHLPPASTLNGIAISRIQKFLRKNSYRDFEDDDSGRMRQVIDLRSIDMRCEETFQILSSLASGGFIEPCSYDKTHPPIMRLTDSGKALEYARLRKRVPIARADEAFKGIKEGVARLNKEGIREVSEVWLFGSYMRRQSEIGDIDCVILTRSLLPWDDMKAEIRKRHGGEPWHMAGMDRYGGSYVDGDYDHRMIFGARKLPILDGTRINSYDIRAGMACQRVYTAERGWLNEPILDRHPKGAHALIKPKITIQIDQGIFKCVNEAPIEGAISREERILEKARARQKTPGRAAARRTNAVLERA